MSKLQSVAVVASVVLLSACSHLIGQVVIPPPTGNPNAQNISATNADIRVLNVLDRMTLGGRSRSTWPTNAYETIPGMGETVLDSTTGGVIRFSRIRGTGGVSVARSGNTIIIGGTATQDAWAAVSALFTTIPNRAAIYWRGTNGTISATNAPASGKYYIAVYSNRVEIESAMSINVTNAQRLGGVGADTWRNIGYLTNVWFAEEAATVVSNLTGILAGDNLAWSWQIITNAGMTQRVARLDAAGGSGSGASTTSSNRWSDMQAFPGGMRIQRAPIIEYDANTQAFQNSFVWGTGNVARGQFQTIIGANSEAFEDANGTVLLGQNHLGIGYNGFAAGRGNVVADFGSSIGDNVDAYDAFNYIFGKDSIVLNGRRFVLGLLDGQMYTGESRRVLFSSTGGTFRVGVNTLAPRAALDLTDNGTARVAAITFPDGSSIGTATNLATAGFQTNPVTFYEAYLHSSPSAPTGIANRAYVDERANSANATSINGIAWSTNIPPIGSFPVMTAAGWIYTDSMPGSDTGSVSALVVDTNILIGAVGVLGTGGVQVVASGGTNGFIVIGYSESDALALAALSGATGSLWSSFNAAHSGINSNTTRISSNESRIASIESTLPAKYDASNPSGFITFGELTDAIGTNQLDAQVRSMISEAASWQTQQTYNAAAFASPYPGFSTYSASTNALAAIAGYEQNLGMGNYMRFGLIDLWTILTGASNEFVRLRATGGNSLGVQRTPGGAMSKVWDETNDGAGSGLDADLLGGSSFTNYIRGINLGSAIGFTNQIQLPLGEFFGKGGLTAYGAENTNTPLVISAGVGTYYAGPTSALRRLHLLGGRDISGWRGFVEINTSNSMGVILNGLQVIITNGVYHGDGLRITNVSASTFAGYLPTDFVFATSLVNNVRVTTGAVTSHNAAGTTGELRRNGTNVYLHIGGQWVTWSVVTNFSH